MLVLLMLFWLGIEMDIRAIYWIVWGVAFTIETINLFGAVHIDIDDEEDNNK